MYCFWLVLPSLGLSFRHTFELTLAEGSCKALRIGYSMFCVGYGIYGSFGKAPECIFHKQHKTLYKLFSPVVSYVADKQVLNREIQCIHIM